MIDFFRGLMGGDISFKRYIVLGVWYFLGFFIFLYLFFGVFSFFYSGGISIESLIKLAGVFAVFGCVYDFIYLRFLKNRQE